MLGDLAHLEKVERLKREKRSLLKDRLSQLKKERNAIILVHNYQIEEVQDVADYIGDSLGLAQQAARADAEVIVFCGVHFMAESAAILSPDKIVLLPEEQAGCPLADMIEPEDLRQLKAIHPRAAVISYVNTSAAVKAESDICCTSSNAVKVVESINAPEIIFTPDKNLGHYVSRQTGREMILWPGYCVTHHRIKAADLEKIRRKIPDAPIIVHPECRPEVVELADHVASTGGIVRFARESKAQRIIIGTEMGIIYRLRRENPGKQFYLLHQGLICPNMKMNTLEKVVRALETLEPRITVDPETSRRALGALERMLAVT